MTYVYQSAHVTICTPASTSCHEGVLGERISAAVAFRSKIEAGIVGSYTIRPCGLISDPRIAEGDYETIDNSDTNPRNNWWKRGWTFQELVLSTRVLLFGVKLHVVFQDKFWSESDEEITEADEDGPAEGLGDTFVVISVADALESGDHESMWMSMVEQYTARELTFESDKLPAMSGLARTVVCNRRDKYLAGIREESLHRDLFWMPEMQVGVGGKKDSRMSLDSLLNSLNAPRPYIAPSWSWARWKGRVRFDGSPAPYGVHAPVLKGEDCLAKAYIRAEARTSKSELNPFGRVIGGSLKITGIILPILPQLKRQDVLENHWVMHDCDQYVADLTFDWDEGGISVPFERMHLVLIGSYWSWDVYKTIKLHDQLHSDGDDDDAVDASHDENEMSEDVTTDIGSSDEGDDTTGSLSSESEEISFEEALDRDADVDKFAYGLILHPAREAGKYFRVGMFTSWPKE